MKKAAILSITAFYLLLTTGMFVCMVHCTAGNMLTKPAMAMAMGHRDKDCCKDNKKDCCKKHGIYVIKENIKPATELQFAQTAILIHHFELADFLLSTPLVQNTLVEQTKAPPNKSGRAIIIQNHTFLI